MLETIREYARERLAELEDADAVARRHADWYLAFAERAEPHLDGPEQVEWLDRIEVEHPNLREALRSDEVFPSLLAALGRFWLKRGFAGEGQRLVEERLPRVPDDHPNKPKALAAATLIAVVRGDWPAATEYGERCLELAAALGDDAALVEGASPLGRALLAKGDEQRAIELFEFAAERAQATGRFGTAALALLNLGYASLVAGRLERAGEYLRRSVHMAASCGDVHAQARALAALASTALEAGLPDEARDVAARSLAIAVPAADRDNVCWALELAGVARAADEPERAARLLGAAQALREELGINLGGLEQGQHEHAQVLLEGALGPDALMAAVEAGRRLPVEDAAALALKGGGAAPVQAGS